MKVMYALNYKDNSSYLDIQMLDTYIHKYFERTGMSPGVIYASAPVYQDMLNCIPRQPGGFMPLSKKKRFFHYTCIHGVIPVIPELNNKAYEIGFSLSEEFEREFEKIILGGTS